MRRSSTYEFDLWCVYTEKKGLTLKCRVKQIHGDDKNRDCGTGRHTRGKLGSPRGAAPSFALCNNGLPSSPPSSKRGWKGLCRDSGLGFRT